jgi:GNAT superfamily N-acetyltransferase
MGYSLRELRKSDWPAVSRAADAALPNEHAMNREWLAARQNFPSDRCERKHYVVEADGDGVIGYGAIEGGEQVGRFRMFVVMDSGLLDAGPADLLFDMLLRDLAALRAKTAWTRELAYDLPLHAFFRRRGFTETHRFRTNHGNEVVMMEMLMNIRLVDKLASADADALWGGIEHPMGTEFQDLEWRAKDLHFFLDDAETKRPLAHVSLLRQEISVAGEEISVGGIGGVFTAPAARGQGHAATLIEHALHHARDRLKCRFGMLLCNDRVRPYYDKLGWQLVSDPVTILHGGQPICCPTNVMVKPLLTGATWPAGAVDLHSRPW